MKLEESKLQIIKITPGCIMRAYLEEDEGSIFFKDAESEVELKLSLKDFEYLKNKLKRSWMAYTQSKRYKRN